MVTRTDAGLPWGTLELGAGELGAELADIGILLGEAGCTTDFGLGASVTNLT